MPIRKQLPFKMTSVSRDNRWLKMLVYGKPGSGKTTLAASVVDIEAMNDVFMISAESGDLVIQDNSRVKHPERLNGNVAQVVSFKDIVKMYEFLSAHCKARDANDIDKLRRLEQQIREEELPADYEPMQYRTVIVDSLTEVEAYCMYGLLGIHGEFDTAKLDDDMKTAEFAEYKKNNNMMNLFVRALRDLPLHVIIVAGQEYSQDEMKRFHYSPALTGKLRTQVQGYFDVVGYLAVGAAQAQGDGQEQSNEQPRRLYVQPVAKFDAKNRRASYKQPFFDNPTMTTILDGYGMLKKAETKN